jgi:gamma-glutamylcyclotransferase (GGCT)/AIG2-like uncharacterized protein YtfP
MTTLLFVYGTLRRNSRHPMARRLADRAGFLGEATMPGRLYDLGRYPGVLQVPGAADRVVGDLYDLGENAAATLAELDEYEQIESPLPAFFDRRLATATTADGTPVVAWVYWYRGEVDEARRITSGRYEKGFSPDASGA